MNPPPLLPADMQRTIQEAIKSVEANSAHDLHYRLRWQINRLMDDPSATSADIGRWRRQKLAALAASKVIPAWERSFPGDRLPHNCLAMGDVFRRGEVRAGNVEELWSDGWDHCDQLIYDHQDRQNDALAGYAAVQSLRIALLDDLYPEVMDQNCSDENLEPEDLDSAFSAAACYAGGTIWDPSSSAQLRREFWLWWLTQAVPQAWHTI